MLRWTRQLRSARVVQDTSARCCSALVTSRCDTAELCGYLWATAQCAHRRYQSCMIAQCTAVQQVLRQASQELPLINFHCCASLQVAFICHVPKALQEATSNFSIKEWVAEVCKASGRSCCRCCAAYSTDTLGFTC